MTKIYQKIQDIADQHEEEREGEEEIRNAKNIINEKYNYSLMCVCPYGISPRPLLPYFHSDDIKTMFNVIYYFLFLFIPLFFYINLLLFLKFYFYFEVKYLFIKILYFRRFLF